MSKPWQSLEIRNFGRRRTSLRAWITVPGRPRLPCTVLDLSIGGALLGLERPSWLPYNFILTVETTRFQTWCEVRHQRAKAVGVRFLSAVEAAYLDPRSPVESRSMHDKDAWTGERG